MMISVIIPAYNSSNFIERTLSSVLTQTFKNIEILIIDDGSEDGTDKLIRKWMEQDKRVKYFYKENGGVSSARNLGIEMAQGEYLAFLDSDDTYEPEYLEKMLYQIKRANALLCFCGYYCRSDGNILDTFPKKFDFQDVLKYIIEMQWISTDSWLLNREFIRQHQICFNEEILCGEDFDFFCRLIYKSEGCYTFVEEYLTNYDYRPGSLSGKGNIWHSNNYISGNLNAAKSFYEYVQANPGGQSRYYTSLILERINKLYLRYLWGSLLLGTRKDFESLYDNYRLDYQKYHLYHSLPEKKYSIWKFIVTHHIGRIVGKCFFKPYKYLQRSFLMRHIKSVVII